MLNDNNTLFRVRDSSGKPAMSEANEVQAWHATSLPAYSPTPKRKRRGHAQEIIKHTILHALLKQVNTFKVKSKFLQHILHCFPLYAIVLGGVIRLMYTSKYPLLLGDGWEYHFEAVNILKYGTFSRSEVPPIQPTYTRVPGYPLFLAGVYFLFGIQYKYALIVQVLLSVITAYWIFRLILDSTIPKAKQIANLFLIVHVVYFRADIFVNHILSETLTTFITVGIAYYLLHQKNLYKASILLGYGMIVRVDMVILPVFILLFLWIYRKKYLFSYRKIAVSCFLLIIPISLWIMRNAITFGIFMPVSAPFPIQSVSKSGFALWCKTWITNENEMQRGHWSIMFCEYQDFGKADIPQYAFWSDKEKQDILAIQHQINETHTYTPAMDSIFRQYAYLHIQQKPFKVLVLNPIRTGWNLWVHTGSEYFWFLQGISLHDAFQNPFIVSHFFKILLSGMYVLLLLFAFLGLVFFFAYKLWKYRLFILLIALWLHRTSFYMFLFLPEHRYMTSALWIVWVFSVTGIVYMYDLLSKKRKATLATT